MAQELDLEDWVSFQKLLMASAIMSDALLQLLIEKGIITQEEFFTKLKQVQAAQKERTNE